MVSTRSLLPYPSTLELPKIDHDIHRVLEVKPITMNTSMSVFGNRARSVTHTLTAMFLEEFVEVDSEILMSSCGLCDPNKRSPLKSSQSCMHRRRVIGTPGARTLLRVFGNSTGRRTSKQSPIENRRLPVKVPARPSEWTLATPISPDVELILNNLEPSDAMHHDSSSASWSLLGAPKAASALSPGRPPVAN